MENVKRRAWVAGLWAIGLLMVALIPYEWKRDSGFMRVLWVFLAVGVLAFAGLLTRMEILLRPRKAEVSEAPQEHVYLSTGCLHGEHAYCQSMTGQQGEKRPGRCKFCDARCTCSCHAERDSL
ncbi:hypothetical protein [Streptomyces sp. NPDC004728]|uniref:hypothetical protein n=1 Tax=Streptomyces sp. NPDC004728 TaxID=3154289 RepID=UPI0033AEA585